MIVIAISLKDWTKDKGWQIGSTSIREITCYLLSAIFHGFNWMLTVHYELNWIGLLFQLLNKLMHRVVKKIKTLQIIQWS